MARVTPQEYAQNWQTGLSGSVNKISKGIDRTRKNPMEKAVAAIPKMQQNFNAAIAEGRVAEGFNRVSFDEWKAKFKSKGLPRIDQGAREAVSDMARFGQELLSHIDAGLAQQDSMPTMTKADTKAKMNAWFDHMSSFKRSR